MILTFDIGNTTIDMGLFQGRELLLSQKINSDKTRNSAYYSQIFNHILTTANIEPARVKFSLLCSVVPELTKIIQTSAETITRNPCQAAELHHLRDFPVLMEQKTQIGMDRLVNTFAAYQMFESPLIVIDFGTATTFNVISSEGEFLGGVISPGIKTSLNALIATTSQLPSIALTPPKQIIGKNTAQSMQSGIIIGYAGMVDSIVQKIHFELGYPTKVIATGGLARLILPVSTIINEFVENLCLKGLQILAENILHQNG